MVFHYLLLVLIVFVMPLVIGWLNDKGKEYQYLPNGQVKELVNNMRFYP